MKISVVIIAGNEEAKIGRAIKSAEWADEVLVIDSESMDRTQEIARSLGCRLIVRPWPGFSEQKQFGVESAEHDWIFSLDADEVITPELREEIISKKDDLSISETAGFRVPRLSYYMGRAIKHSGWYPDWQLRLFDRRRGKWSQSLVHESFKVEDGGRIERLKNDLLHYSVDNAVQHHRLIGERYAPLAAEQMFNNGKKTSISKIMTAGFTAFLSTYFLKAGILDGMPGFCIARFAAHHAFLKHLCLWELQNQHSDKG